MRIIVQSRIDFERQRTTSADFRFCHTHAAVRARNALVGTVAATVGVKVIAGFLWGLSIHFKLLNTNQQNFGEIAMGTFDYIMKGQINRHFDLKNA